MTRITNNKIEKFMLNFSNRLTVTHSFNVTFGKETVGMYMRMTLLTDHSESETGRGNEGERAMLSFSSPISLQLVPSDDSFNQF